MKTKKSIVKFENLPDTITPLDYAEWRGVGENTARNIFNSKGFPRIQGAGVKQIADKRAVLLYELGISNNSEVLEKILKKII